MTDNHHFRLNFYLRRPHALRAEWPLFARISVGKRCTEVRIDRTINPDKWDQKRAMSKGRGRRDLELNQYLELVRTRFMEIHHGFIRDNKPLTPTAIKAHFIGTAERPKMMCEVFSEANTRRKREFERGDIVKATYQRWIRCAGYMSDYFRNRFGSDDIPVSDVTAEILDDFEHFLRMEKSCANDTAVRYMRCVKNVMQYALAKKWITHDPFVGKRYKRTRRTRQFLTEPELMAVFNLDCRKIPRLDIVKDTFIFCCFTGLAFCDVKRLTDADINTDADGHLWIRKERAKTGETSIIPLLDIPRRIVDKYRRDPAVATTGLLLPVITNQKMNAYLKEIADLAGIKKNLTTHMARHTFASMSLCNNVPIEVISKMLGHSDIRTTQLYARLQDQAIFNGMENMRRKYDTPNQF